jgi:hypothetical protein
MNLCYGKYRKMGEEENQILRADFIISNTEVYQMKFV